MDLDPRREAKLAKYLEQHKILRVMGVDDTPFDRHRSEQVAITGVVCAGTRFEGMIWDHIRRDGDEATAVLIQRIRESKFYPQLHVVLLDGIALGGFNVIDLSLLASELQLPVATVMRRAPDLPGMRRALRKLGREAEKMALIERAGTIYQQGPFWYQVQGLSAELMGRVLAVLTDRGHVPEALRLAHLIGAAVCLGESSKRA